MKNYGWKFVTLNLWDCLVTRSFPTLVTPLTVVHQASLSMGFSRQEYWDGWSFSSPGDLPNRGIETGSPGLQIFYHLSHQGSPNIVQEVGAKTIPKIKKCKKSKWFSDEALQIAEKRREAKGKGERGRYTQLNAEFQRIGSRDKKAFLGEQCKEMKANNRL